MPLRGQYSGASGLSGIGTVWRVSLEERLLRQTLSDEHKHYVARAPTFIPGLGF